MKRTDILAAVLLIAGGAAALGQATAEDFALAAVPNDTEIALGESYTVNVRLASAVAGIEAWAFGLCVDAAKQEIVAAQPGDNFNTLRFGGPPEWWAINIYAGGVTQAVMLDTRVDAVLGVIPQSDSISILKVELRPTQEAADTTVTVPFCNTVGAPPVMTGIMLAGAEYAPAVMTPSSVAVVRDPALLLSYTSSVYNLALLSGAPVTTVIKARSTSNLYGFSFGVRHDATLLRVTEVGIADELRQALGNADPEFFIANLSPGNGSGFTVAVLFQTSAPVPPATDLKSIVSTQASPAMPVITARYVAANGVASDQTTSVSIVGTLGTPAVPILYDIGREAVPTVRGCDIAISDDPIEVRFIRGEINGDGRITISDAVMLLRYLFSGQFLPYDCPEAVDCNDDKSINVGDAIYLLGYQFSSGPQPPAPFPECGTVPADANFLGCTTYPACQ
ncbi:MAG TPA: hypothetical protein DCM87_17400 [Planctomycetes bacterium]|nr:hypothetical protein [Planctomycetota bacterium]